LLFWVKKLKRNKILNSYMFTHFKLLVGQALPSGVHTAYNFTNR
jgi:hypothetical protein